MGQPWNSWTDGEERAGARGGEGAAADNRDFNRRTMAEPDPTRFILLNTSHPGNVGAAARAMKVMGFCDLVLVAPRDASVLVHADALAMASGATEVLAGARIVEALAQALDGMPFAVSTAMTPGGVR